MKFSAATRVRFISATRKYNVCYSTSIVVIQLHVFKKPRTVRIDKLARLLQMDRVDSIDVVCENDSNLELFARKSST